MKHDYALRQISHKVKNLDELFVFLQVEWNKIEVRMLKTLVHSMANICEEVIRALEYCTKYYDSSSLCDKLVYYLPRQIPSLYVKIH